MSRVASSTRLTSRFSLAPFDSRRRVFPSALGLFLIGVALLKTLHPTDVASIRSEFALPFWLVLAAVQAELLVGFLLASGRWPRQSWLAALSLFTVFATFSLYRGLAGYASCGCFGAVAIRPWWTPAFDLAIICLLVAWRSPIVGWPRYSSTRAVTMIGAAGYVAIAASTAFYLNATMAAAVLGDGSSLGDQQLVVLDPPAWVGQKLPVAEYFSPSIDLSYGQWLVVFYHHDCPRCVDALRRYETLGAEGLHAGASNVLFVEMPPYEQGGTPSSAIARHVRLSDRREWFVQTPVEIRLADGIVTGASFDLPSVADFP
ncbi:MAG: MauE/DoxX family redox-associated membrane protein [Pirellulales bacterium]